MASATVFLMYVCVLLPRLAAQEDDKPCVFPFTYQKQLFSSCTAYETADGRLWCATTRNYHSNDKHWKWCTTRDYGGNSDGRSCAFPFFYQKKAYYACATGKFDKPWCATTGSYDEDKKWSYCADTRLSDKPIGPCIFPFVFEGQNRSTCVTDGSPKGKLFCSLTDHYDADLKKVPCINPDYRSCAFPFIYKGNDYCVCTPDGTTGGPMWCATVSNYDKKKIWKVCDREDMIVSHFYKCTFPFTYLGKSYFSCTTAGSLLSRHWCSMTSNYDVDGEWEYCSGSCF